jgi:hypothetical protein
VFAPNNVCVPDPCLSNDTDPPITPAKLGLLVDANVNVTACALLNVPAIPGIVFNPSNWPMT